MVENGWHRLTSDSHVKYSGVKVLIHIKMYIKKEGQEPEATRRPPGSPPKRLRRGRGTRPGRLHVTKIAHPNDIGRRRSHIGILLRKNSDQMLRLNDYSDKLRRWIERCGASVSANGMQKNPMPRQPVEHAEKTRARLRTVPRTQ